MLDVPSADVATERPVPKRSLILLAFLAFISLGLPDTLLGVAWPSIRGTFDKPIDSLGLLLMFGTAGYLTSSFLGGTLLRQFGVGPILAASCGLVTLSLGSYAVSPVWPGLFVAALLGGIGAGAIDAAINAYGARAFSPRVLNWLHASWGIGATAGPATLTIFIANNLGWRPGYGTIAAAMVLLTLLFVVTRAMWRLGSDAPDGASPPVEHSDLFEALARRPVQGQTLFFFLYVGFEAGTGTWLYTLLRSRGVEVAIAGSLVAIYWASLTLGRITFGQIATMLRPMTILRIGLIGATVGAVLLLRAFPLGVNVPGAILIGFCLAPVFPTMISLTPQRVGERYASHSVGFQVSAAALGIALLPGLIGVVAKWHTIEVLPVVLLCLAAPLLLLNELLAHCMRPRASASVEG